MLYGVPTHYSRRQHFESIQRVSYFPCLFSHTKEKKKKSVPWSKYCIFTTNTSITNASTAAAAAAMTYVRLGQAPRPTIIQNMGSYMRCWDVSEEGNVKYVSGILFFTQLCVCTGRNENHAHPYLYSIAFFFFLFLLHLHFNPILLRVYVCPFYSLFFTAIYNSPMTICSLYIKKMENPRSPYFTHACSHIWIYTTEGLAA